MDAKFVQRFHLLDILRKVTPEVSTTVAKSISKVHVCGKGSVSSLAELRKEYGGISS